MAGVTVKNAPIPPRAAPRPRNPAAPRPRGPAARGVYFILGMFSTKVTEKQ